MPTYSCRVKSPFWFDVFKHYKKISAKCTPVTFDDFVSECLHYKVNICRGKRVACIRNWMDCGIVPWDILLVHMDTYHIMNSKQNVPMSGQIFCCMKGY